MAEVLRSGAAAGAFNPPLKYLLQPARYQLRQQQQQHVNKAHAFPSDAVEQQSFFPLAPSGFHACSQIRNKRSECLCLTILGALYPGLRWCSDHILWQVNAKRNHGIPKGCASSFFLLLHLDKFSIILCSVQDKPVKERGWYLLIISAPLTGSHWRRFPLNTGRRKHRFFFFQKKEKWNDWTNSRLDIYTFWKQTESS